MDFLGLSKFLEPYLQNVLAEYVEGTFTLDLSKDIQLEKLQLKPSLVPDGVPLALECGLIGRLRIELPLLRILSRPVRVVVEDVTLVLRIERQASDDSQVLDELAADKVAAVLAAMSAGAPAAADAASSSSGGGGGGLAGLRQMLGRMATRVLHNVEFEISRVHVRVLPPRPVAPKAHGTSFRRPSRPSAAAAAGAAAAAAAPPAAVGAPQWVAGVRISSLRLVPRAKRRRPSRPPTPSRPSHMPRHRFR